MGDRDSAPTTAFVAGLAALVAVVMIAQQIASKAVRDGFFLSEFDVSALPVATFAGAAVSFGAALYVGKLLASSSPAFAVPVLFAVNGGLFLLWAALVGSMPRPVAAALFLHISAFGGAVVSGFWSVVNERFDPYTAKRVMGRIAGGATFGGVLGGVLVWLFADVDREWLLLGFGASSLLCAAGVVLVARRSEGGPKARKPSALFAGASSILDNPYLRSIGLMVFLGAFTTAIVDFVFKAGVVEAGSGSLVGFFAVFYTATGVVTFVVQAVGSRRLLKGLGVVQTVGLLPVTAVGLLGVALLWPSLWTLILLRGGAMVVENSLYRSGYELLYTAVPREQKRGAKVLIDLGCDRLGTAAASGAALLVLALAWTAVDRTLLLLALVSALGAFGLLVVVRPQYVASLVNQLRRNLRSPEESIEDPARRLASTFLGEADLWEAEGLSSQGETSESSATTRSMSREALLAQVRARAASKAASPRADQPRGSAASPSVVSEELLVTPLRERLRERGADDPTLLQSAPALVGQLGDILLSRREGMGARLHAAELLAAVPSPRGVAALVEVLGSPRLRLRRAGALALFRVSAAAPALRPPRSVLTELAARELRRPSGPLGTRSEFERQSPFMEDARGNELAPSLELVFLLLAIHGDADELRLALTGMTSDDATQRGTALEYLDNLLPGDLRARLLALAEHPELTQADRRVSEEEVRRLAEELRAGRIGVDGLRRRFREARREEYDQRS